MTIAAHIHAKALSDTIDELLFKDFNQKEFNHVFKENLNYEGCKMGMVFIRSDGTTKFIPIDPKGPFKRRPQVSEID